MEARDRLWRVLFDGLSCSGHITATIKLKAYKRPFLRSLHFSLFLKFFSSLFSVILVARWRVRSSSGYITTTIKLNTYRLPFLRSLNFSLFPQFFLLSFQCDIGDEVELELPLWIHYNHHKIENIKTTYPAFSSFLFVSTIFPPLCTV